MSWDMWHVEGYGFRTETLSGEDIYDFMENHKDALDGDGKKLFEELKRDIDNGLLKEDLDCEEIREATFDYSLASIIVAVINKENDVSFISSGMSDAAEEAVLFVPCYPWEITEREKKFVNKYEIDKICEPYIKELNLNVKCALQDFVFSG